MSRFPRLLSPVLLLLAAAVHAQSNTTNVQVHLFASTDDRGSVVNVPIESTVVFDVNYGWNGIVVPEDVTIEIDVPGDVVLTMPDGLVSHCVGERPVRCNLTASTPSQSGHIRLVTKQRTAGTFTARTTISTSTPEGTLSDNTAQRELTVLDRASLSISGFLAPHYLPPGGPAFVEAEVFNVGLPARDVTVEITLPDGGELRSAATISHAGTCSTTPDRAVSTVPLVGYLERLRVRADFTTPNLISGGVVTAEMRVSSSPADHEPADNRFGAAALILPHILVTNTRDTGAGSLRQAILTAGQECTTQQCVIGFRIRVPVPENGWFTIQPRTPLPAVTGFVDVLGATQTAFSGDTNPDGPEIEINGSLLPEGTNGLRLGRGCAMGVFDLAINGFPRHAIEAERVQDDCPPGGRVPTTFLARNYLGTDARGRTAVPNERGIVLLSGSITYIWDNVISGNRRAGIFAWKGYYADIRRNRIGVNAIGEPLGNGASGMFLNLDEGEFYPPGGADVEDNIIANNREWGIARTKAGEVSIRNNQIYDNMFYGIDVDLDFETPNRDDDITGGIQPNKPVLFMAFYNEARNETVVRGEIESKQAFGGSFRIDLYASRGLSGWGHPQGEKQIASRRLSATGKFEIVVDGDYRGKLITATNSRTRVVGFAHLAAVPSDTSEFSNVVRVH